MVTTNLDVTYTIIWSLALANILGAGLCIALAIPISRLTLIPFQLLAPFMITVICFASFQATRDPPEDLVALLVIGVIGILHAPLRLAAPGPADRFRDGAAGGRPISIRPCSSMAGASWAAPAS